MRLVEERSRAEKIFRWAVSGGITAALQYAINQGLSSWLSVFLAGALAYLLCGQINFTLHSTFNWRIKHATLKRGRELYWVVFIRWCKFMPVNASAAAMNGAIQLLVVDQLQSRIWAFLIANAVSAPYNFILLDKVVFKNDEPPTELAEGSN